MVDHPVDTDNGVQVNLVQDLVGSLYLIAPRAAWLAVENEVVIYTADTSMTYLLNPTASLLWQCLDGESTTDEILRDLADAFGIDAQRAFEEFAPVVKQWHDDGLVVRGA